LDRVHELVCAIEAPDLVRSLKGRFLKFVDVKRALAVGILPCDARSVVWFLQVDASSVRFDGLDSSGRSALVRELVGDWALPVSDLILQTNFDTSHVWRTADMDPLPALATGNLAFVGDSGHPLLPFTSQGVSSALADAVALGDMMDLFPNDIPTALQGYSDERLPEVTALQRAGQQLRRSFLDRGASGEEAATPFVVPPMRNIP
jgi:2-polyprenyl-6-methoxyphenol hydroxylase-like FAD-dependent oxidoreductase